MQCFCVTRIKQSGREYFVANYPAKRKAWSRKAPGRKQKKFAKREAAETFLEEAKREWVRNGEVSLAVDTALHFDVMRGRKLIDGIPWASLEKGALLLGKCVSARELRGTGFEAPLDRTVALSPRAYLGCKNEAKLRGISVKEAVIAEWLLFVAEKKIAALARDERREYETLKKRNEVTRWTLAEWEKEKEMYARLGQDNLAYENGRKSVLLEQRLRRIEWRKKRKETASNGNGDI